MRSDRRGFLVGGTAGLATILSANVSFGGLFDCCRRRRTHPAAAAPATQFHKRQAGHCPPGFSWSIINPLIPDDGVFTPSTNHKITIFGAGIFNLFQSVGVNAFVAPTVSDNFNPSLSWTVEDSSKWVFAQSAGNPDSWSFNVSETGSAAGKLGGLTITVALNTTLWTCGQTYFNMAVLYS